MIDKGKCFCGRITTTLYGAVKVYHEDVIQHFKHKLIEDVNDHEKILSMFNTEVSPFPFCRTPRQNQIVWVAVSKH